MDVKRPVGGKTGEKRARLANPRRRGPVRSRPTDAPLTAFVHIPKTAGTTFMAILRDNFPGSAVGSVGNSFKGTGGFEPGPMTRLRDAPVQRTRDMHVLTGHLPFAVRDVLPEDTRYVTFLRDPVERTLSQYYGLLKLGRRRPLPGDGSLAAVLAEGDVIYDNLQTRMLSSDAEPVGEIDEETLEQAKANLRRDFTVFGLVERFDESLVLIKRALDLRSVTYVQQRVTSRPRGAEVPEEAISLVNEHNNYDNELYAWAREHFEHTVAEQGLDFAADVAAVNVARTGAAPAPPPPAAADPAATWDLLVRTRAELFVDRRNHLARAFASRGETRNLIISLHDDLRELKKAVTARPAAPAVEANAGGRRRPDPAAGGTPEAVRSEEEAGPAKRGRKGGPKGGRKSGHKVGQKEGSDGAAAAATAGAVSATTAPAATATPAATAAPAAKRAALRVEKRNRLAARVTEVAALRDDAVKRLGEVNERIQAIEDGHDADGSIELERLRRDAAQLGKRAEQLTSRAMQFEDRLRQEEAGKASSAHPAESDADD